MLTMIFSVIRVVNRRIAPKSHALLYVNFIIIIIIIMMMMMMMMMMMIMDILNSQLISSDT